jgi:CBS domain-containing protein
VDDESPYTMHEAVTPPPPPDARWLHTPVRAFMRPGVVTLAADASLLQAQRAMIAHGVHAVLIAGADGPVGWITAGGLLPWLGQEPALYTASSALSEMVAWIAPTASAADALRALADPAISHLVVAPRAGAPPQGVVSEIDLVRLATGAPAP